MVEEALRRPRPLALIGWREWVVFPQFDEVAIKAKIDTGAKTSAVHAYNIVETEVDGASHVAFDLHPVQRKATPLVSCQAPVLDRRDIKNSGGQSERRYVIRASVVIGAHAFEIDMTLTRRDEMGFRMLLGRDAVKRRFLVNPAR
ncbi:MAG: RimK/LysX family protein, partial [Pseudomonadota bacterium]